MTSKYRYVYIIAITYAIVVLAIFPRWTVDDAYISFRYADNWAKHSELTWNVGEDPIEGYTGVALPVMLGALIRLGIDPVTASQAIGALSLLIGGLVLFLLLRKAGVTEPIRCVTLLLYFTAPSFYIHAYSGLETMLFSTTILASLYVLLKCLARSGNRILNESLLFLLLLFDGLVRPEGVVLAATSLAVLGFVTLRYRQNKLGFLIRAGLLILLPGFLYFLWRWSYYGQFLPNTFYAKSFSGIINHASVWQLRRFLLTYIIIPLTGIAVLHIIDPDRVVEDITQRRQSVSPFIIAYGAVFAFMSLATLKYLHSTLMMTYSFRFFVPFLPILLTGTAFALNLGMSALMESRLEKPLRYRILRALLLALLTGQLLVYAIRLGAEISFAAGFKQLYNDEHVQAALFIRENVPPSEWLVVHNDAGVIPFISQLRTVDFGLLNDEILSKGLSDEDAVEYFYSINAGAAVFTSLDWDRVVHEPRAALIIDDPRFGRYELVRKFGTTADHNYYQFVFLRKDLIRDPE